MEKLSKLFHLMLKCAEEARRVLAMNAQVTIGTATAIDQSRSVALRQPLVVIIDEAQRLLEAETLAVVALNRSSKLFIHLGDPKQAIPLVLADQKLLFDIVNIVYDRKDIVLGSSGSPGKTKATESISNAHLKQFGKDAPVILVDVKGRCTRINGTVSNIKTAMVSMNTANNILSTMGKLQSKIFIITPYRAQVHLLQGVPTAWKALLSQRVNNSAEQLSLIQIKTIDGTLSDEAGYVIIDTCNAIGIMQTEYRTVTAFTRWTLGGVLICNPIELLRDNTHANDIPLKKVISHLYSEGLSVLTPRTNKDDLSYIYRQLGLTDS